MKDKCSVLTEGKKQQYCKAPRYSWDYYGISKDRYRQLTEYIRSGRYVSLASSAAHRASEIAERYILMSVTENLSYDDLESLWSVGKIERLPYCKSNFYGLRRYFYSLVDKEFRKIGK